MTLSPIGKMSIWPQKVVCQKHTYSVLRECSEIGLMTCPYYNTFSEKLTFHIASVGGAVGAHSVEFERESLKFIRSLPSIS